MVLLKRSTLLAMLLLCRATWASPNLDISTNAIGNEPAVIPVGLDAYRQWARWPYQRLGMRAYMRSTYDRSGGNEGGDASHFLYQLADDDNVTLDVEGAIRHLAEWCVMTTLDLSHQQIEVESPTVVAREP